MSDTRPPITAGPIERAFRFLKSASLSGSGDEEGLDVKEGDGVSCANEVEIARTETSNVQQRTMRVVITAYHRVIQLYSKRIAWFGAALAPRVPVSACRRRKPIEHSLVVVLRPIANSSLIGASYSERLAGRQSEHARRVCSPAVCDPPNRCNL